MMIIPLILIILMHLTILSRENTITPLLRKEDMRIAHSILGRMWIKMEMSEIQALVTLKNNFITKR